VIDPQNSIAGAKRKRYFVVGMHRPYADFRFCHAEIRSSEPAKRRPRQLGSTPAQDRREASPGMGVQARLEPIKRTSGEVLSAPQRPTLESWQRQRERPDWVVFYLMKTIQ